MSSSEPDTEQLQELFRENDDFQELVVGLNNESSSHQLISAVEGVGRELAEEIEHGRGEWQLDHITLGWCRLAWEAYNERAYGYIEQTP